MAETAAATLFAGMPDWNTACAITGGILLAVATAVTAQYLTVDAIRAWTRARSVSETIKAEVYTFRAGAEPYTGPDALDILLKRTAAVQESAQDLLRHVAEVDAKGRPPVPALSRDEYIEKRVEQQINGYYRKKARYYARLLSWLRKVQLFFGVAGAALGFLATRDIDFSAWVAVVTTLGTALAAHVAANRYDFIVMSYTGTALRLEDLVAEWRSRPARPGGADVAAWSAFVKLCEQAISIENESWLAKFAEDKPAAPEKPAPGSE